MGIEIKDLGGLSKPVTKLIEVVSDGIGTLYKPRSIRKKADAEAYKKEQLALAEAKKIQIIGEANIEVLERAKRRLVHQELLRQENIEEIAEKSISYLGETVSEDTVDLDWRSRFFNKAQDVSSDEMQEIWAKILASEVNKPGTISLRTLEVLSNISKYEAEIFQIACTLISGYSNIWKINKEDDFKDFNLIYGDLMTLKDAQLLHSHDIFSDLTYFDEHGFAIHSIGKEYYSIINTKNEQQKDFSFSLLTLTQAGSELCELIDAEFNIKYQEALLADRQKDGYKLTKLQIEEVELLSKEADDLDNDR